MCPLKVAKQQIFMKARRLWKAISFGCREIFGRHNWCTNVNHILILKQKNTHLWTEEAIERTTYTTILALPWFWQFWNGALIVLILNPLMCPLMPLGWLWRASKFIKVSFCLERMNYWKGDFYVLYCPNQNVLYKSPLVFNLFIEVNRKRNKRRLYKQSELLLTTLKGLNLT